MNDAALRNDPKQFVGTRPWKRRDSTWPLGDSTLVNNNQSFKSKELINIYIYVPLILHSPSDPCRNRHGTSNSAVPCMLRNERKKGDFWSCGLDIVCEPFTALHFPNVVDISDIAGGDKDSDLRLPNYI